MATKDADLAGLRINRAPQGAKVPRGSRSSGKIIGWLVALALILAVAFFFKDFFNSGVEVQLATASLTSPSEVNAVLTASGYVVARRKAAVASKGTGRLVFLGVEEGDKVNKGQVIARLEDADVVAAREHARQNLRLAEADLYEAKKNLERTRILVEKEMIAQAEYDVAEARYKRVVATIEAAKFALREADVAVQNTRIVAPFNGTVLKKNADVGEIVAPLAGAASSRAAVVTIADMSSLEVDADVSEANITRVMPDQPCEITLDAYPQRRYPGYVANIVSEPVLAVPAAAVAERDGRQVVFQITDNRAEEVPVTVGRKLGGSVEIKSGLKEGDKVIAKVDERIKAGAKVSQKTN